MLDTIKDFKAKHGREPNKTELMKLTGYTWVTVQKKIKEMIASGELKKKPPITQYADYEVI